MSGQKQVESKYVNIEIVLVLRLGHAISTTNGEYLPEIPNPVVDTSIQDQLAKPVIPCPERIAFL